MKNVVDIGSRAKRIVNRLSNVDVLFPVLNRKTVEKAFVEHFDRLGVEPLPVRWVEDAEKGYSAARSAAWSAAESAGLHAIGRDVPEMEKWVGIWLPFVDAYCAGLWLFWVTEKEVIAVPRSALKIVDDRLHSTTGPAVSWPDGVNYYFYKGTQVPAEWIESPSVLAPETALTWPNAEQRRVAAEIVGWSKILEKLSAKVVDTHRNLMIGTLLRADLPEAPGEQFLRVRCGTGRDFCLPVPKSVKTALEAQAWMWPGLTESEILNMEVRT